MAKIKIIRDEDKDEIIQEACDLLITAATWLEACNRKPVGDWLREWVEIHRNLGVE